MPVVSTMTRDMSSNIAVLKTATDEVDTQLQNDRQYSDLGPQLGVGANGMTTIFIFAIKGPKLKTLRPRLHEIGSKWIRTQTVMDRPYVHTGLNGSEPIWIRYPYQRDHFRK